MCERLDALALTITWQNRLRFAELSWRGMRVLLRSKQAGRQFDATQAGGSGNGFAAPVRCSRRASRIELTAREFELLGTSFRNRGRVVSREMLALRCVEGDRAPDADR